MTDEELDEARAVEALERAKHAYNASAVTYRASLIAARLAREGWLPPDPLDIEVEALLDKDVFGPKDPWRQPVGALLKRALQRGIELGKAEALTYDAETVERMRREATQWREANTTTR